MKIKCVRCGAKSKMALCPDCQVPIDGQVITTPSFMPKAQLPTLNEIKGGAVEVKVEAKNVLQESVAWAKKAWSSLKNTKEWNITYDKDSYLILLKDVATVIVPFLIVSLILVKIGLQALPNFVQLQISEYSNAIAYWILNMALGIGVTVSGKGSIGIDTGGTLAALSATGRIIASGLTVVLILFLAKKSKARTKNEKFKLNTQSEILVTSGILMAICWLLTTQAGGSLTKGFNIQQADIKLGVAPDYYTLILGPIVVGALSVLFGSFLDAKKAARSLGLRQVQDYFIGTTSVISALFLIGIIVTRNFILLPILLIFLPTATTTFMGLLSGVPLAYSLQDVELPFSIPKNFNLLHPTLNMIPALLIIILIVILAGIIMGLRYKPSDFSSQIIFRNTLVIALVSVVVEIYFGGYLFATGAVLGEAKDSNNFIIFNPLGFLIAAAVWSYSFHFGARYLSSTFAFAFPKLVTKAAPKLRLDISDYYKSIIDESSAELSPLEKQTKAMYSQVIKSYSKKIGLAAVAIFLIVGPLNNFIAGKISSPSKTVTGYFDALNSNDAGAALGYLAVDSSYGDISKSFLTSEALRNYVAKPKLISFNIDQASAGKDAARAEISYNFGSDRSTLYVSLVKDFNNKKFGIFPVWKLTPGALSTISSNNSNANAKYAGQTLPKDGKPFYAFPGSMKYEVITPFSTTTGEARTDFGGENLNISNSSTKINADAESQISKLVIALLNECNINPDNAKGGTCVTLYQSGSRINNLVLTPDSNAKVSNIYYSDYSNEITFDYNFTGNVKGSSWLNSNITEKVSTPIVFRGYLSRSDGFTFINWSNGY